MKHILIILSVCILSYIVNANDVEYRKNAFGQWVQVKNHKTKKINNNTTTKIIIKLGYKGTYSNSFNMNGGVIGFGVILTNMYIGGDISIEHGKYIIQYNNITPSIVIGHKYIRAKIGIVISTNTNHNNNIGSLVGSQFKIPISDEFGFFIEPSVVLFNGYGNFSMGIGFEFEF